MNQDPLKSKYVKHVLKYRPNGVTARLAKELHLHRTVLEQYYKLGALVLGFVDKLQEFKPIVVKEISDVSDSLSDR